MPAQFYLPELPFDPTAFGPALSKDTFDMHHGGHHKAYVDKLNSLADANGFTDASLLDIIRETADADPQDISEQVSAGDIFVHAAQHFNHAFYWKSLSPDGGAPEGKLLAAIERDFGSVEDLKAAIVAAGVDHFASGWVWLVADEDGRLEVMGGHDAQTPVIDEDLKPILVLDVWEHAYYLNYQNRRPDYIKAFWSVVNWSYLESLYQAAK